MNKTLLRSLSLLTLTCFLCSCLGEAAYAVVELGREAAQAREQFEDFIVPLSAGRVTGARSFGSPTVVVHIQDLHCHPEAQKNISRILAALDKKYKLDRVYVEGVAGALDTSWLSGIADERLRGELTGELLAQGKLTGAEHFSVSSRRPDVLAGLEDEALYRENLLRLNAILDRKDEFSGVASRFRSDLAVLKRRSLSAANLRFDRLVERRRAGSIGEEKYYRKLLALVRELEGNAARSDNIVVVDPVSHRNISLYLDALRSGRKLSYRRTGAELRRLLLDLKRRVPYGVYARLAEETDNFTRLDELYLHLPRVARQHGIDIAGAYPRLGDFLVHLEQSRALNPVALLREEKDLVEQIRSALSRDTRELEVAFLSDFLGCLEDYLLNTITPDDYAYFSERYPRFKELWLRHTAVDRFSRHEAAFRLLDEFYRANVLRNERFIRSVEATMPLVPGEGSGKEPLSGAAQAVAALDGAHGIAVLVTGGFHGDGVRRILERRRISYVEITPGVSRRDEIAGKAYDEATRLHMLILSQALAVPPVSRLAELAAAPGSSRGQVIGSCILIETLLGAVLRRRGGAGLEQAARVCLFSGRLREIAGTESVEVRRQGQGYRFEVRVRGRGQPLVFLQQGEEVLFESGLEAGLAEEIQRIRARSSAVRRTLRSELAAAFVAGYEDTLRALRILGALAGQLGDAAALIAQGGLGDGSLIEEFDGLPAGQQDLDEGTALIRVRDGKLFINRELMASRVGREAQRELYLRARVQIEALTELKSGSLPAFNAVVAAAHPWLMEFAVARPVRWTIYGRSFEFAGAVVKRIEPAKEEDAEAIAVLSCLAYDSRNPAWRDTWVKMYRRIIGRQNDVPGPRIWVYRDGSGRARAYTYLTIGEGEEDGRFNVNFSETAVERSFRRRGIARTLRGYAMNEIANRMRLPVSEYHSTTRNPHMYDVNEEGASIGLLSEFGFTHENELEHERKDMLRLVYRPPQEPAGVVAPGQVQWTIYGREYGFPRHIMEHIRQAEEEDVAGIVALAQEFIGKQADEQRYRKAVLRDGTGRIWVYRDGDGVQGYLYIRSVRSESNGLFTVYVDELFVSGGKRQQGIARALWGSVMHEIANVLRLPVDEYRGSTVEPAVYSQAAVNGRPGLAEQFGFSVRAVDGIRYDFSFRPVGPDDGSPVPGARGGKAERTPAARGYGEGEKVSLVVHGKEYAFARDILDGVRLAEWKDAGAIAELSQRIFPFARENDRVFRSKDMQRALEIQHKRMGPKIWVYEGPSGAVEGYVFVTFDGDEMIGDVTAEVQQLAVSPDSEGRGVGAALWGFMLHEIEYRYRLPVRTFIAETANQAVYRDDGRGNLGGIAHRFGFRGTPEIDPSMGIYFRLSFRPGRNREDDRRPALRVAGMALTANDTYRYGTGLWERMPGRMRSLFGPAGIRDSRRFTRLCVAWWYESLTFADLFLTGLVQGNWGAMKKYILAGHESDPDPLVAGEQQDNRSFGAGLTQAGAGFGTGLALNAVFDLLADPEAVMAHPWRAALQFAAPLWGNMLVHFAWNLVNELRGGNAELTAGGRDRVRWTIFGKEHVFRKDMLERIGLAREQDVDDVIRLSRSIFGYRDPERDWWFREMYRLGTERREFPFDRRLWVYRDGSGAVRGYAYVTLRRKQESETLTAQLAEVAVDPAFHRKGIATALTGVALRAVQRLPVPAEEISLVALSPVISRPKDGIAARFGFREETTVGKDGLPQSRFVLRPGDAAETGDVQWNIHGNVHFFPRAVADRIRPARVEDLPAIKRIVRESYPLGIEGALFEPAFRDQDSDPGTRIWVYEHPASGVAEGFIAVSFKKSGRADGSGLEATIEELLVTGSLRRKGVRGALLGAMMHDVEHRLKLPVRRYIVSPDDHAGDVRRDGGSVEEFARHFGFHHRMITNERYVLTLRVHGAGTGRGELAPGRRSFSVTWTIFGRDYRFPADIASRIEPATEDDVPKVSELASDIYRDEIPPGFYEPRYQAALAANREGEVPLIWVYRSPSGNVEGFLLAEAEEDDDTGRVVVHMGEIAVARHALRRGIGKTLQGRMMREMERRYGNRIARFEGVTSTPAVYADGGLVSQFGFRIEPTTGEGENYRFIFEPGGVPALSPPAADPASLLDRALVRLGVKARSPRLYGLYTKYLVNWEELIFRLPVLWLARHSTAEGLAAAVVSSAVFGLAHPGRTRKEQAFLAGLGLAFSGVFFVPGLAELLGDGTILITMGLHTAYNAFALRRGWIVASAFTGTRQSRLALKLGKLLAAVVFERAPERDSVASRADFALDEFVGRIKDDRELLACFTHKEQGFARISIAGKELAGIAVRKDGDLELTSYVNTDSYVRPVILSGELFPSSVGRLVRLLGSHESSDAADQRLRALAGSISVELQDKETVESYIEELLVGRPASYYLLTSVTRRAVAELLGEPGDPGYRERRSALIKELRRSYGAPAVFPGPAGGVSSPGIAPDPVLDGIRADNLRFLLHDGRLGRLRNLLLLSPRSADRPRGLVSFTVDADGRITDGDAAAQGSTSVDAQVSHDNELLLLMPSHRAVKEAVAEYNAVNKWYLALREGGRGNKVGVFSLYAGRNGLPETPGESVDRQDTGAFKVPLVRDRRSGRWRLAEGYDGPVRERLALALELYNRPRLSASLLDGWLRGREAHERYPWRYRLYTVFGVAWEDLVFRLPVLWLAQHSTTEGILAAVASSVLFGLAHAGRTWKEKSFLAGLGLAFSGVFFVPALAELLGDGAIFVSMGLHTLYNGFALKHGWPVMSVFAGGRDGERFNVRKMGLLLLRAVEEAHVTRPPGCPASERFLGEFIGPLRDEDVLRCFSRVERNSARITSDGSDIVVFEVLENGDARIISGRDNKSLTVPRSLFTGYPAIGRLAGLLSGHGRREDGGTQSGSRYAAPGMGPDELAVIAANVDHFFSGELEPGMRYYLPGSGAGADSLGTASALINAGGKVLRAGESVRNAKQVFLDVMRDGTLALQGDALFSAPRPLAESISRYNRVRGIVNLIRAHRGTRFAGWFLLLESGSGTSGTFRDFSRRGIPFERVAFKIPIVVYPSGPAVIDPSYQGEVPDVLKDALRRYHASIKTDSPPATKPAATARDLLGRVRYALPFRSFMEFPHKDPRSFGPDQQPPTGFSFQNNRLAGLEPCSGGCFYCYISKTVRKIRRAAHAEKPVTSLETVRRFVDEAVNLGLTCQICGEDTFDDMASFWTIVTAYRDAVGKYRAAGSKDLQRMKRGVIELTKGSVRERYRGLAWPLRIVSNGFLFVARPGTAADVARGLKERLGDEIPLSLTLSWDPGKVRDYARRLNIGEDEVLDRMADTVWEFERTFGGKRPAVAFFSHDANNDRSPLPAMRSFRAEVERRVSARIAASGPAGGPAGGYMLPVDYRPYRLITSQSVRWAARRGKVGDFQFRKVSVLRDRSRDELLPTLVPYDGFLDLSSERYSFSSNYPELWHEPVSPDSLEHAVFVDPFHRPLVRWRSGKIIEYAVAALPELGEQTACSPEEVVSYVLSDEALTLKVELLMLCNDILAAAGITEGKETQRPGGLEHVPAPLLGYFLDDDFVDSWVRLKRGGAGGDAREFKDMREEFKRNLREEVIPRLVSAGILGSSAVDLEAVPVRSAGTCRIPLLSGHRETRTMSGLLASLFEDRLRDSGWARRHPRWHRFYTDVLVNWEELVFRLPVLWAAERSALEGLGAALLSAALFGLAHAGRTRNVKAWLSLSGFAFSGLFFIPGLVELLGDGAIILSMGLHTLYNAVALRRGWPAASVHREPGNGNARRMVQIMDNIIRMSNHHPGQFLFDEMPMPVFREDSDLDAFLGSLSDEEILDCLEFNDRFKDTAIIRVNGNDAIWISVERTGSVSFYSFRDKQSILIKYRGLSEERQMERLARLVVGRKPLSGLELVHFARTRESGAPAGVEAEAKQERLFRHDETASRIVHRYLYEEILFSDIDRTVLRAGGMRFRFVRSIGGVQLLREDTRERVLMKAGRAYVIRRDEWNGAWMLSEQKTAGSTPDRDYDMDPIRIRRNTYVSAHRAPDDDSTHYAGVWVYGDRLFVFDPRSASGVSLSVAVRRSPRVPEGMDRGEFEAVLARNLETLFGGALTEGVTVLNPSAEDDQAGRTLKVRATRAGRIALPREGFRFLPGYDIIEAGSGLMWIEPHRTPPALVESVLEYNRVIRYLDALREGAASAVRGGFPVFVDLEGRPYSERQLREREWPPEPAAYSIPMLVEDSGRIRISAAYRGEIVPALLRALERYNRQGGAPASLLAPVLNRPSAETAGNMYTLRTLRRIFSVLLPFAVAGSLRRMQERYLPEETGRSVLDRSRGALYYVVDDAGGVLGQAAGFYGMGAGSIVISRTAPAGAESAGEFPVFLGGRRAVVRLFRSNAHGHDQIILHAPELPDGTTFGAAAEELIRWFCVRGRMPGGMRLDPLVVVSDEKAFREMAAAGLDAGPARVVDGSRNELTWDEGRQADLIMEGIGAMPARLAVRTVEDTLRLRRGESVARGRELTLGIGWRLVDRHAGTLAGVMKETGAGNIRLKGATKGAPPERLVRTMRRLRREGFRVFCDYILPAGAVLDGRRQEEIAGFLAGGRPQDSLFEGVEIDASGLADTDAGVLAEWVNGIGRRRPDAFITVVPPAGMNPRELDDRLGGNVTVIHALGEEGRDERACVKAVIGKGFDLLALTKRIENVHAAMFEISFEEGAVFHGDAVTNIARSLIELISEDADIVYEAAASFPVAPSAETYGRIRSLLERQGVRVRGGRFEAAFTGKSDGELKAFLEDAGRLRDGLSGEGDRPLRDRLSDLLARFDAGAEQVPVCAGKTLALLKGAGQAGRVREYLERRGRRGFERGEDRLAFGSVLWDMDGMLLEAAADPGALYARYRGQTDELAALAVIFHELGEGSRTGEALAASREAAGADPSGLRVVALALKDTGRPQTEETLASLTAAGPETGVYRYLVTGERTDALRSALEAFGTRAGDMGVAGSIAYARAIAAYGELSYADTGTALDKALDRARRAGDKASPSTLAGSFRILDLLSDERVGFGVPARDDHRVLDMRAITALLGAS